MTSPFQPQNLAGMMGMPYRNQAPEAPSVPPEDKSFPGTLPLGAGGPPLFDYNKPPGANQAKWAPFSQQRPQNMQALAMMQRRGF